MTPCTCEAYPMAWATLEFSKRKVDWAGRMLIQRSERHTHRSFEELAAYNQALEIINNFRSSHGYPLHATTMTLRGRLRSVDSQAEVVSRLKRLFSIDAKLRRFDWLKLSRMQDIGGSRAVLNDVTKVERVMRRFEYGKTASKLKRCDDYIGTPKEDGYRGVHYVYEYQSTSEANAIYDGFQVEVQLRSTLQHIWATANEIVSTFTGQRLKAGRGEDEWLRFFALMSCAIAMSEKRPLVPGTPADEVELLIELYDASARLQVEPLLSGWYTAMNHITEKAPKGSRVFLLVLDTQERRLRVIPFPTERVAMASEQYLEVEKEMEKRPGLDVVLVKADSVAALRKAYPNYYADARAFLTLLDNILSKMEIATDVRPVRP